MDTTVCQGYYLLFFIHLFRDYLSLILFYLFILSDIINICLIIYLTIYIYVDDGNECLSGAVSGHKTQCKQQYSVHKLLALSETGDELVIDTFR